MNLLSGLTWLTMLTVLRRRPRRETPDLADMGTAFGLDASVDADSKFVDPAASDRGFNTASSSWSRRVSRQPPR